MAPVKERLFPIAFWCMFLSAASVVLSIAVCQIFLGLALIALIASNAPLRFPPIKAPLAAFLGWTLLSMLASGDPGAGLPQVRKMFVFTVLLVASSVFLEARHGRWLAGAWFLTAALSAARSLVQFGQKIEAARARGEDFYQFYVGERITGFLSHWMTFSGVGMLVLLVLLSYLFFAPGLGRRGRILGYGCAVILVASLLVSFTRTIWVATAAASAYLIWNWRKKLLLAGPVVIAVAFAASPEAVRKRVESMGAVRPDDSSYARVIMWRTGWNMIQARPLVGMGPERIAVEFRGYVPPDVSTLPEAFYGHLHNVYIHYAAERGIPALIALVWLLATILWDHAKALRKCPPGDDRFILYAVIAVLIGILVGGLFEVNLGDSEVLTVFLVMVSLGYAAIQRQGVQTSV